MAKKLIVSFVLDETGSMASVKQATISGFNEYIETLRGDKEAGSIRFTFVKFNSTKMEIVHDGVRLSDVEPLTNESYQPYNLTPLYDAIGITIKAVEGKLKKKGGALIIVQTDGCENDSKEYDQKMIFDLITEKKKEGWTFVFLGADQDAWLAGGKLGFDKGNVLSYDSEETEQVYLAAAMGTRSFVSTGGQSMSSFWDDANNLTEDDE